jgi:hypothetical protein
MRTVNVHAAEHVISNVVPSMILSAVLLLFVVLWLSTWWRASRCITNRGNFDRATETELFYVLGNYLPDGSHIKWAKVIRWQAFNIHKYWTNYITYTAVRDLHFSLISVIIWLFGYCIFISKDLRLFYSVLGTEIVHRFLNYRPVRQNFARNDLLRCLCWVNRLRSYLTLGQVLTAGCRGVPGVQKFVIYRTPIVIVTRQWYYHYRAFT